MKTRLQTIRPRLFFMAIFLSLVLVGLVSCKTKKTPLHRKDIAPSEASLIIDLPLLGDFLIKQIEFHAYDDDKNNQAIDDARVTKLLKDKEKILWYFEYMLPKNIPEKTLQTGVPATASLPASTSQPDLVPTTIYIIGGLSDLSEVYMTNIALIRADANSVTRYTFPTDLSIDRLRIAQSDLATLFDNVGEAYIIETPSKTYLKNLRYNLQNSINRTNKTASILDFDGDGIQDLFLGIQQSGTSSFASYYVISFAGTRPQFLGFNVAEDWKLFVPRSEIALPDSNFTLAEESLLLPIDLYNDGIYELQQSITIYDGEAFNDKKVGTLVINWWLKDGSWQVQSHKVFLERLTM